MSDLSVAGKKLWASKTVWVNMLTLVAGVAAYVAGSEVVADNATLVAALVAVQGAVNIVLRLITTQPIK